MELSFVKRGHEFSSFVYIKIEKLKAVFNGHESELKSKHALCDEPFEKLLSHLCLIRGKYIAAINFA